MSDNGFHQRFLNGQSRFIQELIFMDKRIQIINSFFTDKDEEYFYSPSKSMILFPGSALPKLSHEISHMVEMKEERCILRDWGFGKASYNAKRLHYTTGSHIFTKLSRETRVLAIERHMRGTCRDGVHLTKNNTVWEKAVRNSLPFGRFKRFDDVVDWAIDLDRKTYSHWSLDRIKETWTSRLNYIRNWMETK